MSSARAQILTMLANHRIDVALAERLLSIAFGRERFVTLTLCMALVSATAAGNLLPPHAGEHLVSALYSVVQSAMETPAWHHFCLILNRLLGELP